MYVSIIRQSIHTLYVGIADVHVLKIRDRRGFYVNNLGSRKWQEQIVWQNVILRSHVNENKRRPDRKYDTNYWRC